MTHPATMSARAESRLPVLIAIASVLTLQIAIPARYTAVPRWPLIVLELLLLLVILVINPLTAHRHTVVGTWAMRLLTGAITVDNTTSAAVLDYRIISGQIGDNAAVLLGSGGAIYLTNVIAFGIWFWVLDRGGPCARLNGEGRYPAFLFPQMSDPDHARPDWRPIFVDYLYVSFTNSVAFSPTDTMPLARWAKSMMTVQALVATTTVALVFTRAVSLLN
ncbi:MAG: hypothetical protein JST91_13590 [Actinobacteria bacterium]|nr:hypothetical protein [Actinomycetota bacterium]